MGEEESLKFFSKFNEQEIRWKDQKFEISSPWIFHAPDPRSTRSDKWLPLAGGSRSKKKNPGFLYNPIHLWPGCSHPLLLAAAVVVVGSRQLPLSLPFSFSLEEEEEIRENFTTLLPSNGTNFVHSLPFFILLNLFREKEEREREVCVVSLFSKKEGGKLIETREFWESFEAQDLCEEKKRRKGEKRLSLLYFLSNGSSSSN